jgi:hypothetical protein
MGHLKKLYRKNIKLQGSHYFSSVPVLHYIQAVHFLKFEHFS